VIAMALGHGLQDGQKTSGVIVLALSVGGYSNGKGIPLWVEARSPVRWPPPVIPYCGSLLL